MSTQSVPQGRGTDMMYRGDIEMPLKENINPENMVLPAVETPEVIAMRKQLLKQLKEQGKGDAMIKYPMDWTQEELRAAMRERERINDPAKKAEMFKREREWFDHTYGTGPVQFDETGKMIQPQPVRKTPVQSKPIKSKDGKDLDTAIGDVISKIPVDSDGYYNNPPFYDEKKGEWFRFNPETGEHDKLPGNYVNKGGNEGTVRITDGPDIMPYSDQQKGLNNVDEQKVIKVLQAGLNILSNQQNQSPLPNTPKVQILKEDGIAGPKTAFGLKKALVDQGTGKVSEAVALGQFKETVKKAKKDGPQNLAGELGASFGPLLGKKKAPKQGFQPEGLALQDTLNDLGAGLKDDGIVGPKTTDAFSKIAKTTDEDDLVNRFAYNLGFDF